MTHLQCPACRYDLTRLPEHVAACPECGRVIQWNDPLLRPGPKPQLSRVGLALAFNIVLLIGVLNALSYLSVRNHIAIAATIAMPGTGIIALTIALLCQDARRRRASGVRVVILGLVIGLLICGFAVAFGGLV